MDAHRLEEQFLRSASSAIAGPITQNLIECFYQWFPGIRVALLQEWFALLSLRNGFYAFDRSLLIRPFHHRRCPLGVMDWNLPELWKSEYDMPDVMRSLFFAEDVFGTQFCMLDTSVMRFDPEVGEFEPVADSIIDWIDFMCADIDVQTGRPVILRWQAKYSVLDYGEHLLPKVPFVLGGGYEIDQLYTMQEVKSMRWRASLAVQLRGLSDGDDVVVRID